MFAAKRYTVFSTLSSCVLCSHLFCHWNDWRFRQTLVMTLEHLTFGLTTPLEWNLSWSRWLFNLVATSRETIKFLLWIREVFSACKSVLCRLTFIGFVSYESKSWILTILFSVFIKLRNWSRQRTWRIWEPMIWRDMNKCFERLSSFLHQCRHIETLLCYCCYRLSVYSVVKPRNQVKK